MVWSSTPIINFSRQSRRFSMKLKVFRSAWGLKEEPGAKSWEQALSSLSGKGYAGVECSLGDMALDAPGGHPTSSRSRFIHAVQDNKLEVICGVYTSWQDYEGGWENKSVKEHLENLCAQLELIKDLGLSPTHVNVHSGSDSWTFEECVSFFSEAQHIERDSGLLLSHETHRGRALFNPFVTARLLDRFPSLHLTADFSHWVVVCERLLGDGYLGATSTSGKPTGAEINGLSNIMHECAARSLHIHARVGHSQSAQVGDPMSEEYSHELRVHEGWWDSIWESRRRDGASVCTLTPEYGPYPYSSCRPLCQKGGGGGIPAWQLVDQQFERQMNRFASIYNAVEDSSR